MDSQLLLRPYNVIAGIAADIRKINTITVDKEGLEPDTPLPSSVVDSTLFANTRGYFEKLVYQINMSYVSSCYDACALLIRKLVELLIEDIYESQGRVDEIVNQTNKQLYGLGQLISVLMSDNHWKLNRHVEDGLNLIKTQGDKSAHNRRYNARKADIDKVQPFLRDITEELLYLAKIRE